MSKHTIKGLRSQFKAQGKFHTPPELVATITALAKTQLITEPREVYDPTCGAGDLLSAWGDTPKYGQDIDVEAVEDAKANLTNFHGVVGDVLADPAWLDKRFHLIVANPPFSIKWTPQEDERFEEAPTIPTQSKADYAFILHILHMLDDDGVAVVMGFPGILYRGGREGKIRQWLVEQNLISHVIAIPGGKFEDTAIATCVLIIQKCRDRVGVEFIDMEHELQRFVKPRELEENGFNLAVSSYVQPPEPERKPVDAWALQLQARRQAIGRLRKDIAFDRQVCSLEGWDHAVYLADIGEVVSGLIEDFKAEKHAPQTQQVLESIE